MSIINDISTIFQIFKYISCQTVDLSEFFLCSKITDAITRAVFKFTEKNKRWTEIPE